VVKALLIANGVIFLAQLAGFHAFLTYWFALWPASLPDLSGVPAARGLLEQFPRFHIWQLVTYGFLHGGIAHLFFNLLALWMFGAQIEQVWGSERFAAYYAVCVVGAGLTQLVAVALDPQSAGPTIGASGGVFGVLLAFGMMFPNRMVMLLIPPIPMKAKWFVIIYGALELYFGVTGAASHVAHFAHLGGMFFGLVLILIWSRRGRRGGGGGPRLEA
jgi:membrane associated rhomboid family serine protease